MPDRSGWPTKFAGNGIARLDFADCSTSAGHPISSGVDFKMTTTDRASHPLPAWRLLQMHWFLSRIMALSGAANVNVEMGYTTHDSWSTDENASLNAGWAEWEEKRKESRSATRKNNFCRIVVSI
ncbi:hypothetical protein PENNAL_c0008G12063 [Penicillium nalgiovense]|uniref:Uncharacterized protein n=1 Tax=Penicillium nalgiovense TaxID=60175 RepID=A0A1V6YXA5_PENNA|nr:hypothetical protein PENNAL_c0008G12063 [Penicillium nalgiovense]